MRNLPNQEMDLRDSIQGNVRLEPEEQWRQISRGVFRGHEISRADENECHPKCDWQPGLEQIGEAQGGIVMWRGCLTNLASRVNLAAGNAF